MKSKNLLIAATGFVLSLACSINLADTPPPPQTPIVFTQVVVIPRDTDTPAPTNEPAQPTFTSVPTDTVQPPTPTRLPTLTPNFKVSAQLIKDANCRKGPGQAYDVVTSFIKGQVVEVVARNSDFNNTWWQVKIPGTNGKCWISLVTAQASGDFDSLTVLYPPY